jgi:alpha-1,3-glucan synthase
MMDSLDYLQGMGIKVQNLFAGGGERMKSLIVYKGLYLAGSPFINQPWAADSYSPLDLTLLDHHFGNITTWRAAITEIHSRGMYIIMDNTLAT